jgi:hypothetical protein
MDALCSDGRRTVETQPSFCSKGGRTIQVILRNVAAIPRKGRRLRMLRKETVILRKNAIFMSFFYYNAVFH